MQRAADEFVNAYYASRSPEIKLADHTQGGINLAAACNYALEVFVLSVPNPGRDEAQAEKNFSHLIAWIIPHASEVRPDYDPTHEAFERLDRATMGRPRNEVARILARLWVEHLHGCFPIPNDIPAERINELERRSEPKPSVGENETFHITPSDIDAAHLITKYREKPPFP